MCLMRGHLGRGTRRAGHRPGVTCAMAYSFSYGHHGLSPCSTYPEEGTVSLPQATGPILTPETTRHIPAAVLDARLERRRGTV